MARVMMAVSWRELTELILDGDVFDGEDYYFLPLSKCLPSDTLLRYRSASVSRSDGATKCDSKTVRLDSIVLYFATFK